MKTTILQLFLLALSYVATGQTDYGCTDPAAFNYNSSALLDDGSCCYSNFITTDDNISNTGLFFYGYNISAELFAGYSDGVCLPDGCYYVALNYPPDGFSDFNIYSNGELLMAVTAEALNQNGGYFMLSVGTVTTGCTDWSACNFNASATCDDGTCDYSCYGCTDPSALNYNPEATIDNGSCCNTSITLTANGSFDWQYYSGTGQFSYGHYPEDNEICANDGCAYFDIFGEIMTPINWDLTDANGNNIASGVSESWGESFTISFGSAISGCADPAACNYNPEANCFDYNLCDYSCFGCTDPEAGNYNPEATIDNGSCCYGTYSFIANGEFEYQIYSDNSNWIFGTYPQDNELCISDGCVYLDIYPYSFDDNNPLDWQLVNSDGEVIASGSADYYTGYYNIGINAISGCTDPASCNYNPEANCSDYYACDYSCYGCTDPNAPNFDAGATIDNGSCCTNDWYNVEASVSGYWYMYSGNGYSYAEGHYPEDNGFCMNDGCFYLVFYSDDWSAINYSATITLNGDLIASDNFDPLYGAVNILVSNGSISGCMDTYACNFDPAANCSDYSFCNYDCYGCTDATAPNFNPDATVDNGSCCYNDWYTLELSSPGYWSTSSQSNGLYSYGHYPEQNGFCVDGDCFDIYAWADDGQPLTWTVYAADGTVIETGTYDYFNNVITIVGDNETTGCLDYWACNYNPDATCGDYYSCDYSCYGCTDPSAPNFDPAATVDDNSCCYNSWYTYNFTSPAYWYAYNSSYYGYGDYNSLSGGFCVTGDCFAIYIYPMGADPVGYVINDSNGNIVYSGNAYPNYGNLASIGVNGEVAGCLDMSACNYNPDATCEDGSCNYYCGGCTDEAALNYNPEALYDDGTCFYNAVAPNMGMAMIPDEENNQFYVLMSIMDTGNGAPYVMRSDFDENVMMIEATGEYLAGPYPCDIAIEFELQSMPAGFATYLNAAMEGQCATPTGTVEMTKPSGFTIYPNPNNGLFTISGLDGSRSSVRISDMSGRIISEQTIAALSGQVEINLDNLSAGVYQVSVITDVNITTERMVIRK